MPATLGDPDCPHCHGLGYLRRDADPGSPDFGKLDICVCRQAQVARTVRERLFSLSHLDELKESDLRDVSARGRKGLGELQANSLEWAFNRASQYAGLAERLAAPAGRLRLRQDPPGCRHRQLRRRHGRADALPDRP